MKIKYLAAFLLTAGILFLSLLGVAMIPRSAIQGNIEASAKYLNKTPENFYNIIDGADCTKIDQYADSILLNIAYCFDSEHPLHSILWAQYYEDFDEQEPVNLMAVVKGETEANTQYLRYWHGSIVPIRIMLLFWDISDIYLFHGVLIAFLLLCLVILMLRQKAKKAALGLMVSIIAVNLWVVPFCLEYTWMFLVCFAASIAAVLLAAKGKDTGLLFMITGIVAAFVDFLTTETITLVIPLLLTMEIEKEQSSQWRKTIKRCVLWLIGFVGMWGLKWALAAVILRIDVLPYLMGNVEYHLHVPEEMTTFRFMIDGIMRNVNCLFPIGYGMPGKWAVLTGLLFLLIMPICFDKIRLKDRINIGRVNTYFLLGLIPYIRYIAIRYHCWHHYFFTYRAQAGTALSLSLIIAELLEISHHHCKTAATIISGR